LDQKLAFFLLVRLIQTYPNPKPLRIWVKLIKIIKPEKNNKVIRKFFESIIEYID